MPDACRDLARPHAGHLKFGRFCTGGKSPDLTLKPRGDFTKSMSVLKTDKCSSKTKEFFCRVLAVVCWRRNVSCMNMMK